MMLDVELTQTQRSRVFTMPLDLAVATRHGIRTVTVFDSARTLARSFELPDSATTVTLDPAHWILTHP
jgi:hypothetical protein